MVPEQSKRRSLRDDNNRADKRKDKREDKREIQASLAMLRMTVSLVRVQVAATLL